MKPHIKRVRLLLTNEWRWGAFRTRKSKKPFTIARSFEIMVKKLKQRKDATDQRRQDRRPGA